MFGIPPAPKATPRSSPPTTLEHPSSAITTSPDAKPDDNTDKRHPAVRYFQDRDHWENSRLSLPPMVRIPFATVAGFGAGFLMGGYRGWNMTKLRFRAEHSHRLPTTNNGWFLYHKSKNYHCMGGALRGGLVFGARLAPVVFISFATEHLIDVYRGSRDMINTGVASCVVASGYSLFKGFHPAAILRMARTGLAFGLMYGAMQDYLSVQRGRPVGYIEHFQQRF